MPFANLRTPKSDWVAEPKQVRPGLLAARSLLSHGDRYAAISLMNVSGVEQTLREGHVLGLASPCPPQCILPFEATDGSPQSDNADREVVIGNGETQVKCATVHTTR